jgi:hypothetical protein
MEKIVFCLVFFASVLFSATCNIEVQNNFITIEQT